MVRAVPNIAEAISRITSQLSGKSLRARFVRGGVVMGIGVGLGRGLQLVRYMILARLLVPAELGLMAIVLATTLAFEAVFQVGVRQSIIQNKRGAEAEYLNAAWWFQAVRGLVLFSVAFLAAPVVSRFYGKPELLVLLRTVLLALVFRSLISPRAHVLEKKFQFHKVVLLTQASSVFGTLLTIGLAFIFRNVWALVIGFIFEAFFHCLFSFILCPFRPRFSINQDYLRKIIQFARGMFGLPVLAIVASQTDIIVLGKLLPMALVGTYSMALRLAATPKDLYLRIFAPVLLSAFSEKQDDKQCLRGAVLKMTKATAMFGIPLAAFCAVYAGAILSVVFGSEYAAVGVSFTLLSVCGLLRMQGITCTSICLALGQPRLYRGFAALRAVILVCLIYPAIVFFGAVGAATVVLLSELIALCVLIMSMRKRIELRFSEYLSCWLPGLCLTPVVLGPSMLLNMFEPDSTELKLFVGSLSFFVACTISLIPSLFCKRVNFFKIR